MKNLRKTECCATCKFVVVISDQDDGDYYYCNKVGKPFIKKYGFLYPSSATLEEYRQRDDWFIRHRVESYKICDFYELEDLEKYE